MKLPPKLNDKALLYFISIYFIIPCNFILCAFWYESMGDDCLSTHLIVTKSKDSKVCVGYLNFDVFMV